MVYSQSKNIYDDKKENKKILKGGVKAYSMYSQLFSYFLNFFFSPFSFHAHDPDRPSESNSRE